MCKISHILNGGAGLAAVQRAKQKAMYSERTRLIVRAQLQEFDLKLTCTRAVSGRVTKANALTPKRAALPFLGPAMCEGEFAPF